jgi:putative colanic acid biosynthesis acetyltransferase WcaF
VMESVGKASDRVHVCSPVSMLYTQMRYGFPMVTALLVRHIAHACFKPTKPVSFKPNEAEINEMRKDVGKISNSLRQSVTRTDSEGNNRPRECMTTRETTRGETMKRDEMDDLPEARATAWGANAGTNASSSDEKPVPVIDLSLAGKGNYVRGASRLKELVWFFVEALVINNKLLPMSGPRVALLRLFGAKIGSGCRMPHPLRVKYPWYLEVGNNCWFGVHAWIYNQAPIRIGHNVCISQEVFLTSGSHDVAENMDLMVAPIVIEDGVWVSSRSVVQKGVTIGRSSVVTPLSVVHRSLPAGGIYGGNPCRFIKRRFGS